MPTYDKFLHKYADQGFWCPTCIRTHVEKHPYRPVFRCFNCKTWLMNLDGQLIFPPLLQPLKETGLHGPSRRRIPPDPGESLPLPVRGVRGEPQVHLPGLLLCRR